jgi:pyrimidine-nucleoside phosphorylase
MQAAFLIRKKRDGKILTEEEIRFLVNGYVGGDIPDYQISALLMAVYYRGMNFEEAGFLTRAMLESGDVIDLSDIKGPLIDKHSTGGVGDKVSLILAPLAAACGISVPMMSGRSLGHTGGTLDKLESIPGYRTDLTVERFIEGVRKTGFAMTGQSETIVPADRKMYALRDVTATIESVPLITASILSKKIAEGAEGLVFDVKTGAGAFMKTLEDANELAQSLYKTGKSLGKKVSVVITGMDEPLGNMVGNFLEVREVIQSLGGEGPDELMEVILRLTARMLLLGGISTSLQEAEELCRRRISDGSAWEKFCENVKFQGGDLNVINHPEKGPRASIMESLLSEKEGYVERIDAYNVGMAATLLGAGRTRKEDPVLPGVGVELRKKKGDSVKQGDILCLIHAENREQLNAASPLIEKAFHIGDSKAPASSRILAEIGC